MCEGPHRPYCLGCKNFFSVRKKSRKDEDKLCNHCTDNWKNPSLGRLAICDICNGYMVYRDCNGKKNSHWMHCPWFVPSVEKKSNTAEKKNEPIQLSDAEYIRIACGVLTTNLSPLSKGLLSVMLYGARYLQHIQ